MGAGPSLRDLDARAREIFKVIVESYLDTGEPIGSRNLAMSLTQGLSPASVRNVMSDLEMLGLIYAPHTSAGRLPTQLGLRFFVDALLEVGDLTSDERSSIETELTAGGQQRSVEDVLSSASSLLSGLSHGAGLVLTSKANARLKQIEFIPLDPGKALIILVAEDGTVENRVVPLPADLPVSALTTATNYLNARIAGRTLRELKHELNNLSSDIKKELDELTQKVISQGLADWTGEDRENLIVRGRSNLLEDVRAGEDMERLRLLFVDFERKKELIELLGLADKAEGVRIFIGSENRLFSLSGSSLVTTTYRDEARNVVGVLGVIGPTRLNYGRIIPMVDYTAKVVSRILSQR
jgi:heat-inducible transcriptional repressor